MALAWAESLSKTNKEPHVTIVLVDEYDLMDVSNYDDLYKSIIKNTDILKFEKFNIILDRNILELGMRKMMLEKYNIVEYCTSIKPFCFDYFFRSFTDKNEDFIIYMDPDTYVYKDFTTVFEKDKNLIYLTPHIITKTYDTSSVTDNREWKYLQVGIFNLGFIGLRRSDTSDEFLMWWQARLIQHCVIDKNKGIFVDQKWCDFIPSLFDKFQIIKKKGFNIAYWNMYEREDLFKNNGEIFFIHYSVRNNLLRFDFMENYLKEYDDNLNDWNSYFRKENLLIFNNFKLKNDKKDNKLTMFLNKLNKKIGFAI
jgi:hypothetical protein